MMKNIDNDTVADNTAMLTINTGREEHTSAWCVALISSPPRLNMTPGQAGLHSMMLSIKRM